MEAEVIYEGGCCSTLKQRAVDEARGQDENATAIRATLTWSKPKKKA
jgi:hypothetical protein